MFRSRRRKKLPSARKFLWKLLRSYHAVGSMPSWALPIETIAAWMYLNSRPRKSSSNSSDDPS